MACSPFGMGLLPLGVFYLQERLAAGGSAEVWRAVHPPSSLAVAVKLLREPVDADAVAREARAVAALLHPAVVRIVDQGQVRPSLARSRPEDLSAHQPYLVMELGEATLWARPPPPGWRALRRVMRALLDGLAHAHARSIVHCDLKPSNVLWVRRGAAPAEIAIADFGLARVAARAGHGGGGTPRYMAPEQHGDGVEVGPWTDLYALGVMARELAYVQGRPRFELPAGFEAWVDRLSDPRIAFRLQAAAEARYALDALAEVREPEPGTSEAIWSNADVTRPAAPAPKTPPTAVPNVPQARARLASETVETALDEQSGARGVEVDPAAPPPLRRPLPASWREPTALGPIHVVGAGLGLYHFRALPLVGREAERNELWRALRSVVDSEVPRSRAVFLTGGAGVGKSTLGEWLVRRAVEVLGAGAPRIRMREEVRPGNALLFGARRFMGCDHAYKPDAVRAALRRSLPRLVGAVDPVELEALTRTLSISGMDPPPPPAERRRVAVRFLARCSLRRPVVVLLDELQWDEQTVLFLEALLQTRGRILLVATIGLDEGVALPERLSALLYHDAVCEVPVAPLPPGDHRRLIQELLGLSSTLARRVEERTVGNPMFAVQLVGDWVSRGLLAVKKGALCLPTGEEEELPDDLHALFTRRVERLTHGSASDRLSLQVAAVLGLKFRVRAWRGTARALGIPLDERLVAKVLRSHLVQASPDGAEFRFSHGMLRESLLRTARESGRLAALHSAAADAVRPAYESEPAIHAETLAFHLQGADRKEEALGVLLQVIQQTILAGRYDDALVQIADAEALHERLCRPADDRARCQLQVLHARALGHLGRLDLAADSAERALERIGDQPFAELEALALHELGYTDYHRGRSDMALRHLTRAIEVFARSRNLEALCRSLRIRGGLAHSRGDVDSARADYSRALEAATEIGDRASVAASLLGLSLHGVGDGSGALEARRIFEELGHCSGACNANNTLAEVARRAGQMDEAEELYRRGRRWAQMGGVSQHEHICGLNLALLMLVGERYEEAFVETELGSRMTALLGQRLAQYLHESVGIAAAVGAGRMQAAREHLARATELQQRVDHADAELAWAARRACELALERSQPEFAREVLEFARVEHQRLGEDNKLAALEARISALS